MTRKRQPYKTYTKEFKLEAVRLMNESDRPSAEIATELGLRRNQLYKWKEQLEKQGDAAFSGKTGPKPKDQQSEMVKLKKENDRLREKVEILKKAVVLCARPQVKCAFIRQQRKDYALIRLCHVLNVSPVVITIG